jgi:predicted dehydrogenase
MDERRGGCVSSRTHQAAAATARRNRPLLKEARVKLAELRVGLIGAGAIARDQHLPGWLKIPEAKVIAVADSSAAALERVRHDFQIEGHTDYRRILDNPAINVVDICCPSAVHAKMAIAALEAGKHVLCEKPMATCRADAAAMLDTARASGKKLMIGQQMRFDSSIVSLRHSLESFDLGHVYYARGQWLRRRRVPGRPGFTQKEQSGGGPLFDLGVHVIDLTWWLMGCPTPLSATGAMFNHLIKRPDLGTEWGSWDAESIQVEDFAAGMLRFGGGSTMALEVSWLGFQPEKDFSRIQLFGSKAGLVWPDCRLFGETDRKPWDIQLPKPSGEKPHGEVIQQFARSLLDGTPVPIPPRQSANVVAMLEALSRSALEGVEVKIEPVE